MLSLICLACLHCSDSSGLGLRALSSIKTTPYRWTRTFSDSIWDLTRIDTDNDGNIYVIGCFSGTNVNFAAAWGLSDLQSSAGGYCDIFLTKINSDGTYGWTKTFGGTDNDHAGAVAIDSRMNIYLVGIFRGTVNFAASFGGTDYKTSLGFDENIFLTKINSDLTYGWTKKFGGDTIPNGVHDVIVDSNDNILFAGLFSGTVNFAEDFSGTEIKTSPDSNESFITKINSDGTYGWTRIFSGGGGASGIATDQDDNIYVTGHSIFRASSINVNFAVDFGGNEIKGINGTYVLKINNDVTYGWTRIINGVQSAGIAVDSDRNVYISGFFQQTDLNFAHDFSGSDLKSSTWNSSTFVVKIKSDNSYGWTRIIGRSAQMSARGDIRVDPDDNVYVFGYSNPNDNFAADFGESDIKNNYGNEGVFITRINKDSTYGATRVFSSIYCGGIRLDVNNNIYVSGLFSETVNFGYDFSLKDYRTANTKYNIFLTKLAGL
ncbi:MAG: hypothetical protein JXA20_13335 [Spirochaetes bacterium]|nr:hypothetical protein [Spirochaetota bacterium]